MNTLNSILFIIGIFTIILGISWSKKDFINLTVKLSLLASGTYEVMYALYLSGIMIVVKSI